jgi:hypothetical protein
MFPLIVLLCRPLLAKHSHSHKLFESTLKETTDQASFVLLECAFYQIRGEGASLTTRRGSVSLTDCGFLRCTSFGLEVVSTRGLSATSCCFASCNGAMNASCQSDIGLSGIFVLLSVANRPLFRVRSDTEVTAQLCNFTRNKCTDTNSVVANGGRGSSFQHLSVTSNENRVFFREATAAGQHNFGHSKFVGNTGDALFSSAANRVLHVTMAGFFGDKSTEYIATSSAVVDVSNCHFSDTQTVAKRKLPNANVLRNCGYEESDDMVSVDAPASHNCWALLPKRATAGTSPLVYLALAAVIILAAALVCRQFCSEKKPDTAPLMYV